MKALLIIDMQIGSFKPYAARYNTMEVINNINQIADNFRKNGDKVIFIQHDGTKENCFLPNTEDWQLLPELNQETDDLFVSKTVNDSFYQTDLQEILEKHNISNLVITGCATDFCVDSTVKSALTKDYKVTVVGDAHTTASRPHVDALNLIKHYNWLWSETTPAKYKIDLISTADLISTE
ncbi:cysteine hydrolase family protein [Pedobacter punctiformis]|uniref:Cysteine hydrolase family protein n=1 Tax=Pedobacter punctiformis TaxID=3004097 RepID=A0ABT4L7N3_9SPHI|nr:cysteine hydrolase family protein [Pedobacter sp. HCMS5-2]MCZ4243934.1 cysteine hydrolase family protein [Pedobacter sp. HCMS5-2]